MNKYRYASQAESGRGVTPRYSLRSTRRQGGRGPPPPVTGAIEVLYPEILLGYSRAPPVENYQTATLSRPTESFTLIFTLR